MNIRIIRGTEVNSFIAHFAKLRAEIFMSYPYLQYMTIEDVITDLQNYCSCAESIMIAVFDEDQLVGASLAMPLLFEHERWQKPFLEQRMAIDEVFYFRESILLPKYRGRKIYSQFFMAREQCARDYGSNVSAFCSVERPLTDRRKPDNYTPLDATWLRFGYAKHPELCAYEEWVEVGEKNISMHSLVFWIKNL